MRPLCAATLRVAVPRRQTILAFLLGSTTVCFLWGLNLTYIEHSRTTIHVLTTSATTPTLARHVSTHTVNFFDSHNEKKIQLPSCSINKGHFHDVRQENQTAGPKVKVLIVAYERGGSTFTGHLFDVHEDVFYTYEPLKMMRDTLLRPKQHPLFWEKPTLKLNASDMKTVERLQNDILRGFLDCSFGKMPIQELTDTFMMYGKKTRPFQSCFHVNKQGVLAILRCLPALVQSCCTSKVTALKTIRYTMARALTLLAADPKVKVIHLVRDPRPTLLSQIGLGSFSEKALGNASREFCAAVKEDLEMWKIVSQRFPERVVRQA